MDPKELDQLLPLQDCGSSSVSIFADYCNVDDSKYFFTAEQGYEMGWLHTHKKSFDAFCYKLRKVRGNL